MSNYSVRRRVYIDSWLNRMVRASREIGYDRIIDGARSRGAAEGVATTMLQTCRYGQTAEAREIGAINTMARGGYFSVHP